MKKLRHIIAFAILLLGVNYLLSAQESDNKVKVQYIYRMAEQIEWPKNKIKDNFNIAYLGADAEFISYIKLMNGKILQKVPVKVFVFDNIKALDKNADINLIFIDNAQSDSHIELFDKIQNKPILLISDNFPQQKFVMINFIYNDDKTISFEVNNKTINNNNLQVNPKLLLLGGSEIDIIALYKQQEKELDKERENVEKQKLEIEKLNKNIQIKQAELIEKEEIVKAKEKELANQIKKLNEQKVILDRIKSEVTESKTMLNAKVKELQRKEDEIANQNQIITDQNQKVETAKKELDAVNDEIAKKKDELQQKEAEIARKEKQLNAKNLTINSQKRWILIGGAVLLIILILSLFLFKMIRAKNKANRILEYKNIEINNKNSEINSQKEELLTQKELIESQFSETQSSISYAKTIQTAILPLASDLGKFFDNFIIFRPKDVVSGDFYWFTHMPAKGKYSEKLFVAAVDCTGHGVPGAFMSMIGNRLLNEIVNEKKITNTGEILNEMNNNIVQSLQQDRTDNRDGMDLCICKIERLNDTENLVSFSGAKRPLFIYRAKKKIMEVLNGQRKSIGGSVFRNSYEMKFSVQETICTPNDTIYLSTDGFTDQNNLQRKRLGTNRVISLLTDIGHKDMNTQKRVLEATLDDHQRNTEQRDDITFIGIKF